LVAGPNQALGAFGENLAAAWYEENGYVIEARNWRGSAGEIDIVARKDRLLVISEVKTRSSDRFGVPAEAITPAKQRRLRRLATEYLAATTPGRCDIRFDVVSVLAGKIEVIEAAF
jgi:putative endonuclease